MRLVIKNSIQLCLRTLVFSMVLRHSNYNNRTISIVSLFLGHPVVRQFQSPARKYEYFMLISFSAIVAQGTETDVLSVNSI